VEAERENVRKRENERERAHRDARRARVHI